MPMLVHDKTNRLIGSGPIRPNGQSSVLQAIDHSVAGSMTAQPPGSCPSALRVAAHDQQAAPLGGSYPSAEVQSAYSTAPADRVNFASRLQGSCIFSKIDLTKAYHQIPVDPEDIPKTAVMIPFGLYEFPKMPFGLHNAIQTFQPLMDKVLRGLPYVYVYTDDILVARKDEESHKQYLHEVFRRLSHYGLRLNLDKCVFEAPSIDFLGHSTDADGITPLLVLSRIFQCQHQ